MCENCRNIVAEWLRGEAYDVASGAGLGALLLACPTDGLRRYAVTETEVKQ